MGWRFVTQNTSHQQTQIHTRASEFNAHRSVLRADVTRFHRVQLVAVVWCGKILQKVGEEFHCGP